jgi:transglutaminase/protease-like cytokinesis protein 3
MQKKRTLRVFFLLIFVIGLNGDICNAAYDSNSNKIGVVVNGNLIKSDSEPFNEDGRVMISIRSILEALDVELSWNDKEKTVIGEKDNLKVVMPVNSSTIYINKKAVKMDTKIVIVKGRSYGPVRYIAEAFDAKVSWDNVNKNVNIDYDSNNNLKFDEEIINSNYEEEYVKVGLKDNECTVTGQFKDTTNKKFVLINFINDETDNEVLKTIIEVNTKGSFLNTFDMKNINNGRYKLYIYTSSKKYNETYKGFIYDEDIVIIKDDEISVEKVKTYELNKKAFLKNIESPNSYLASEKYSESNNKEIINLSKEITKGTSDNYHKLLAIHDWIANNIYYDYDVYNSNRILAEDVSAVNVMNSKKSVCQGYANLFQALSRAANIPCFTESGYALGISSNNKKWDNIDLNNIKSNHAWNVAFDGDKWIIIDSTWDSGNEYRDGKFINKGSRGYKFFDSSLLFFSRSHYIIN